MYTVIDIEDLPLVNEFAGQWYAAYHPDHKGYYAKAQIRNGQKDGKTQYTSLTLHTYIMGTPKGYVVDHINHDALDNRRINLRIAKYCMNSKNRTSRNSNNKSGYRNVFWNSHNCKWQVTLCRNRRRIYVGSFDDVNEAGGAAETARQYYYGEFAGEN